MLPGKYTVIQNYGEWESDITFFYSELNQINILAEPYTDSWEPASVMSEEIERLRRGSDDFFMDMDVKGSRLIEKDRAEGYEIFLEGEETMGRVVDLRGGSGIKVSVYILTGGKDRGEIMRILAEAVKNNLVIQY